LVLRPLPSCIVSRGEAVRHPLPTIMHFFHEMGSWKYFGLSGNALLYLFSGYIYFFINISIGICSVRWVPKTFASHSHKSWSYHFTIYLLINCLINQRNCAFLM
jgi:hypothetical protein